MFDGLTWFGLFAVAAMLVTYALEHRNRHYVLALRRVPTPRQCNDR